MQTELSGQTPFEQWRPSPALEKAIVRREKRHAALSKPITAEQIEHHSQFLEAVPYGGDFCWIYTAKSTHGRKGEYARFKINGCLVAAHRFALAVKLGCTLWELEGIRAGHAPISECIGGRCCKHVHLREEANTARGAWQRSKDRKAVGVKPERSQEDKRRMVRFMHPHGLPVGNRLLVGETRVIGVGDDAFTISVE
jgi:hypothetical protein